MHCFMSLSTSNVPTIAVDWDVKQQINHKQKLFFAIKRKCASSDFRSGVTTPSAKITNISNRLIKM